MLGTPITVSVIYPGYIRSEMNENLPSAPFMVSTQKGVAAIVDAIEKGRPSAHVPPWTWVPLGLAFKHLPWPLARRLMG